MNVQQKVSLGCQTPTAQRNAETKRVDAAHPDRVAVNKRPPSSNLISASVLERIACQGAGSAPSR
jgi:hypothetical protein